MDDPINLSEVTWMDDPTRLCTCRSHMPATTSGQLTVEKTPSYLVSGRVVERILAMDPDVRLLVVVRDPVTRAVSDYTQAATKRPDIAPFEQLAFLSPGNLTKPHHGLHRPVDVSLSLFTSSVSLLILVVWLIQLIDSQ